ncbi:unnamed protein product [Cunninghamella echinulata]
MIKGDVFSPGEKIKIICRIRPFLQNEAIEEAVHVKDNSIILDNCHDASNPLIFNNFTSCYPSDTSQDTIFIQDVRPLIERVFEGYDSTIFAYGVTGSGKTFTMEGSKTEPGIIPRVAEFLFETKEASQISTVNITMSYMEILKESVFDMLTTKGKNINLDIREDIHRDVFVANLTEKPVETYKDFQKLFSLACKNRSTASTKLNKRSSRSHAILSLKVTTVSPVQSNDDGEAHDETIIGKINLIDLAGSEDNRKSGNGKARMTESAAINKSLFVLGQVVEALNNGTTRIPFRDSKMTRILQSTLTGKSLGMMIINIAPGYNFFTDTFNTLNFAHRSKEIKSTPKANIKRTRSKRNQIIPNDNQQYQNEESPYTITSPTNTAIHPYPSPNRDNNTFQKDPKSISPNLYHRLSTVNFKRASDTYEQRLRSSKRTRYSPLSAKLNKMNNNNNNNHTMIDTFASSSHNNQTSGRRSFTPKEFQKWLKDLSLETSSPNTTTSFIEKPNRIKDHHMDLDNNDTPFQKKQQDDLQHRAWSTITTKINNPLHESNDTSLSPSSSLHGTSKLHQISSMDHSNNDEMEEDQDIIVMTKKEFQSLRQQMIIQAKQELLSTISSEWE